MMITIMTTMNIRGQEWGSMMEGRHGSTLASSFFFFVISLLLLTCTPKDRLPSEKANQKLVAMSDSLTLIAEDLYALSFDLELWNRENPSVLIHYLLACNSRASKGDECYQEYKKWVTGNIHQEDLTRLHRGQFLSVSASLGIGLESPVFFQSGDLVAIEEILDYEKANFAIPPAHFFNYREAQYGHEYAWHLRAFCHYCSPEATINEEFAIKDILDTLLIQTPNVKYEEGTHEYEGMAMCLQMFKKSNRKEKIYLEKYNLIEKYLQQSVRHFLDSLPSNAQFYAQSIHFDGQNFYGCQENIYCRTFNDANKQAHFFEWAMLVEGTAKHPNFEKALARLLSLAKETKRLALEINENDKEHETKVLLISAVSHLVSAAGKVSEHLKH